MARPKIDNKRDNRVKINFTDIEFKHLNEKFKDSNNYHSFNEMLRDILLNNQYKVVTTDLNLLAETSLLIGSVRKIGNNFNQLIKHLNQKKLDNFSTDEKNIMLSNLQEIKKYYIKIENYFAK